MLIKKSLKISILSLPLLFVLTACEDEIPYTPPEPESEAEVHLDLEQILWREDATLQFDVSIERPDLGLKQADYEIDYTVDLPDTLNPKLMYVSETNDTEINYGNSCYRPGTPHRCEITLKEEELEKAEHTFLVKILFEDLSYGSQEITVLQPPVLNKPELAYPITLAEQGDTLRVRFLDVGADYYELTVGLCSEYQNDGIDPCIDGIDYKIVKDNEGWIVDTEGYFGEYIIEHNPRVSIEDGFIIVESDFQLIYEESVYYQITATKESTVNDLIYGEIPTYTEIHEFFELS